MAIRITGMNSGLDTEAIITELVKAQQTKTDTIKKQQTKHQWKQDAWKELNTKIVKFYNGSLSDMRYQFEYTKKSTKVSNESAATVLTSSSAVNSVQNLKINELASSGYLTGAQLSGSNTGSTIMGQLGIMSASTITVDVDGKQTDIQIDGNTTIDSLVGKLQEAGLNANFDTKTQRFFISSKTSGAAGDFNLSFSDENVKFKLGLNTAMSSDEVSAYLDKYAYDASDVEAKAAAKASEYMDKLAELDTELADLQTSVDALTDAGYDTTRTSAVIKAEMEAVNEDTSLSDEDKADKIRDLEEELTKAEQYEKYQDEISAKQDTRAEYAKYVNEVDSTASQELLDAIEAEFETALDYAKSVAAQYSNGTANVGSKIDGQDAQIELNGAVFTSTTNVFEINGLTITALDKTTGNGITLTTSDDTDGIYDKIKSFLKEYNELINEMDKLYNAESAEDYEPLTDEEKAEMSENEIEKWEEKIKSAVLRRDGTLNTVSSAMKEIMLEGVEVNGKKMYLSAFGIETLGYFNAGDNEKNAYHIDGDPDDENTKNNEDKLKTAIANDPSTVVDFFTGLTKSLWTKLNGLMTKTEYSSSFTVYEDKRMKDEYDAYTEKITKQEEKLTALEDKWYSKFSAMETALAKLQSNQSAVTSLLGG